MTAHWGVADPARVQGTDDEKMNAFRRTFRELSNRIRIFVALPFEKLDRLAIKHEVDVIGQLPRETGNQS
ncbi:MAG: hypothetical protein KGR48_15560 [Alphaproteobacteria bacterium]|nr:hypothetical protein [Alphaproteobacteria bacterium]